MKHRRIVTFLHVAIGLSIGVFVSVLGLTGSVLVFRHELDRWLNPQLYRVEPQGERISIDQILSIVHRNDPDGQIRRIGFPRLESDSFEVWTDPRGEQRVYVDPYRAEIIGTREYEESVVGFLRTLHVSMLSGEIGETVVGSLGILLVLSVGSGLVIWWPGVLRLRRGFQIQRGKSRRVLLFQSHRFVGGAFGLIVLVSAITGVCLVFDEAFAAAISPFSHVEKPQSPHIPERASGGSTPLPLAELLEIARRRIPEGQITWVILPATSRSALTVRMRLPGEAQYNGKNYVYLDPNTGHVLYVIHAREGTAGTQVANARYPLHTGEMGGIVLRIVTAVAGTAPSLLFISGGLSWWLRRRNR